MDQLMVNLTCAVVTGCFSLGAACVPQYLQSRKSQERIKYELIKKERYDVVIPVRDATTILFSKYKHKFSNFTKIPIPNYETVMKGRDKAQTVKIALENDIPCPKTYFVENEDSINKIKNKINYILLILIAIFST